MDEINNQINALEAYTKLLTLNEQYGKGLLSDGEYERRAKRVVEKFCERFEDEPDTISIEEKS